MSLNYVRIVTGDFQENCYLVWQEDNPECIVFDPGAEAFLLRDEIISRKLTVGAFVLTHCHGDHIGALSALKTAFPAAPIYCPEEEVEWLERPTLNLSYFFGHSITAPKPEFVVRHDETLNLCGITFKTILVPGHSPGSTAYFIEKNGTDRPFLFCGDILFAGSIGRTDLPGSTGEEVLVEGIREKLFPLPEDTIVFPGHGEATTIGDEKESNPLCGSRAG